MTELLCIQTHSEKLVMAGNFYPLLDAKVCECGAHHVRVIEGGPPSGYMLCTPCGAIYPSKVFWLSASLFAPIATQEEVRENSLIEVNQ